MSTLEAINGLEPIYFAGEQNLDATVFTPICRAATHIRCMTGYFSSGSIRKLAHSLSLFLKTGENPIQFIISPNLSSEDLAALKMAIEADKNLLPLLFPEFIPSEKTLRSRSLDALAFLVASGQMEFKIAVQKEGLFHTKCWVFETSHGMVAVHGSSNATQNGVSVNTEQISVDLEWEGLKSKKVVHTLSEKFSEFWGNSNSNVVTYELNQVTVKSLESIYRENIKSGRNAGEIQKCLAELIESTDDSKSSKKLIVPGWLNYTEGAYSHQGEAVEAWIKTGRGILSIATGGGKTLTSLVAASLASNEEEALLVVIAVPTKALLDQWAQDVEAFSVSPYNSNGKTARETKRALKGALRNLRLKASKNEVLIITHDALKSELAEVLHTESQRTPIMLIGDEVHNLGSKGFMRSAKDSFKYRLGLSATAERQFDEDGSNFLKEYFGPIVYDFPLEKAIGNCLVPYHYHVTRIELDDQEQEAWGELTHEIRKLSYAAELPDAAPEKERWKLLCLQRRRIVESAQGKVAGLAHRLPPEKRNVSRTLIFCTDKKPEQLESVNQLLTNRSINFHQVTADETASKALLQKIVDSFGCGELQILTSKRVLDEGFNIPQTETAYLLASNTVRRQWIQRLGRVLRLSPKTGKKSAHIYDFIVIPKLDDEKIDDDLKGLIRGEYDRVQFFSKLSLNGLERGGSIELMSELVSLLEQE